MSDAYQGFHLRDDDDSPANPIFEKHVRFCIVIMAIIAMPATHKSRLRTLDQQATNFREQSAPHKRWEMCKAIACGLDPAKDNPFDDAAKVSEQSHKGVSIIFYQTPRVRYWQYSFLGFLGLGTSILSSDDSLDEHYDAIRKSFNGPDRPNVALLRSTNHRIESCLLQSSYQTGGVSHWQHVLFTSGFRSAGLAGNCPVGHRGADRWSPNPDDHITIGDSGGEAVLSIRCQHGREFEVTDSDERQVHVLWRGEDVDDVRKIEAIRETCMLDETRVPTEALAPEGGLIRGDYTNYTTCGVWITESLPKVLRTTWSLGCRLALVPILSRRSPSSAQCEAFSSGALSPEKVSLTATIVARWAAWW
ncbi:hypothetical protein LTR17_022822 [Elasticomyces elasticus]|nr:hypothetical protein LTR17_022822 [Elasticomyces elasticus]